MSRTLHAISHFEDSLALWRLMSHRLLSTLAAPCFSSLRGRILTGKPNSVDWTLLQMSTCVSCICVGFLLQVMEKKIRRVTSWGVSYSNVLKITFQSTKARLYIAVRHVTIWRKRPAYTVLKCLEYSLTDRYAHKLHRSGLLRVDEAASTAEVLLVAIEKLGNCMRY